MNIPKKFYPIFAIVVIAVFAGLILALNNANKNSVPVNNSEKNNGKIYLVYSLLNSATNNIELVKYDTESKEKKVFYQLPQNNKNASPIYYKYQDDKILINNTESNADIVIDLNGKAINNAFKPKDDLLLFSPSEKYIAYNKYDNDNSNEYHLIIREIATDEEKTVPAIYAWDNMPAMLHPLSWSDDEKYIYADMQVPTEGYPVGLLTINRETAEVKRNPVVDREKLIQVKLDGQLNVYSLSGQGFDPFVNFATEIIEVPHNLDTTNVYKLTNSKVNQLYGVSFSGRYISYAYSEKTDSNNLWIYDKTTKKEIKITNDSVIPDTPYWHDDLLAYFENASSSNANSNGNAIRIYNASNGENSTVVESMQYSPKFQLIGWFNI